MTQTHLEPILKSIRGLVQLVECLVWDQVVAGSSPASPTSIAGSNPAVVQRNEELAGSEAGGFDSHS